MAFEHNDILGFITVMHGSLFGGYLADIAGLYVLPRHRRHGIGGLLMAQAARWLKPNEISRVTAVAFAHDPTRSFYARLGGFVISSAMDESDPGAMSTYGFSNFKELAARGE